MKIQLKLQNKNSIKKPEFEGLKILNNQLNLFQTKSNIRQKNIMFENPQLNQSEKQYENLKTQNKYSLNNLDSYYRDK